MPVFSRITHSESKPELLHDLTLQIVVLEVQADHDTTLGSDSMPRVQGRIRPPIGAGEPRKPFTLSVDGHEYIPIAGTGGACWGVARF